VVTVLEVGTGTVRRISAGDTNGVSFPRWSPDGKWLAWGGGWVPGSPTGVFVAEVGDTVRVAKVADDAGLSVAWSPDGRQVAFTRFSGGTFRVGRDGGNRRLLHPHGAYLAWSPTARGHLVVEANAALFRVDPDTGVAGFLAPGSVVGWLPDGSRLVAGSRQGTNLIGWDGCAQTVITGGAVAVRTTPVSQS
jgi:Tol biopolymer transport system component